MPEERRRILSFDLLRASAVLYIIFVWHIHEYAGRILYSRVTETLMYAFLSIVVFISGFVLTLKYDHFSTVREAAVFFKKRILRIYPLYVFALALFFFSSLITYNQLLSGVFLSNSLFNTELKTLWFVTMIIIYYVILAALLHTYSMKRTLLVSVAFFFCSILLHLVFDLIDIRFIYYFVPFIAGVISAKHRSIYMFLKNRAVAFVSISLILLSNYIPDFLHRDWFGHFYYIAAIFFSISPLIVLSDIVAVKINKNIIFKFSYASYCMYILHRIIYWMLLEIYVPGSNILTLAYLFFAGLPVIYFISASLQSGYDSLFRKEGLKDFDQLPRRIGFYRIVPIGLFAGAYIYLIQS
ncbi:MAG: acyltransferase family protein [Nitrospirae bacterium]|nr:acyltransferase family protein [Nitrospirota bacterium]